MNPNKTSTNNGLRFKTTIRKLPTLFKELKTLSSENSKKELLSYKTRTLTSCSFRSTSANLLSTTTSRRNHGINYSKCSLRSPPAPPCKPTPELLLKSSNYATSFWPNSRNPFCPKSRPTTTPFQSTTNKDPT